MLKDLYPVHWDGVQVVVTLPEHIGASNAGQVRDALLSVINRGPRTLIADMTATVSCDHAGADAVLRAWQRTVSSGTELRLVVTAGNVARALGLRGLDRQVSVYSSLAAAAGARLPTPTGGQPADGARAIGVPPGEPLDALQDAVALADGDGMIAASSARLEDMFGYGPDEMLGLPVESLMPAGRREGHHGHQSVWARSPSARPTGSGLQLAGVRKDGTTFPVRVSLTPVTTASGPLTLAVVRDITGTSRPDDLALQAREATAAQQEHVQLLDAVITGLSHAALGLQSPESPPADDWRPAEAVLGELGDLIRQIRDAVFSERTRPGTAASYALDDGQ